MRLLPSSLFLPLVVFLGLHSCTPSQESPVPAPTGGTIVKMDADEGDSQDARAAWFELMHQAAPGTDWRAIEYANQMALLEMRNQQGTARGDGMEVLANGKLTGRWVERGSRNQAGSVIATEFDPDKEEIWLISDGGTLYRGPLDGNQWDVVHQNIQFNGYLLKFIPGPQGRRLLTIINKIVHYSDDEGQTWTAASGLNTFDNNWGERKHAVVLDDQDHTIFYLVMEWLPGPWKADVGIYMSKDQGQTFTRTWSFNNGNMRHFAMARVEGSNEVLIMENAGINQTRIYSLQTETGVPVLAQQSTVFGIGTNITAYLFARKINESRVLYTYNTANQLFRSDDMGQNWTGLAVLEERPWTVGLHVSAANPNYILAGGVHCLRSSDGGQSFVRFNDWWDYYGNVNGRLHADMMYFKEFQKKDGTTFFLISNHGGLNISFDGATVKNLGLQHLNVSQYYDVVTDPNDELYIYAGSQDQGFQRALDVWEDDVLDFEQAISGDYGHMVFTGNGQRLWMVYPGGWVTYWPNPIGGGYTANYTMESDNESVWIPPLIADPNPALNVVYMAGGNINGGPGSYIARLELVGNQIVATQLPFDFKAFSGGEVSALAFSPHNPQRMYAATTNGFFFTSQDKGMTWDVAQSQVPGGQYLYGASILPCPVHPDRVYFGGSGYSNPAVLVSEDGGYTFTSMVKGLPSTLVLEMVATPDGQMIFAGTETGPFVYLRDEDTWYPMLGQAAPLQRYWSVDYLPMQNRVRFGTYGRGIWDFAIEEMVSVQPVADNSPVQKAFCYPNPLQGHQLNVQLPGVREGVIQTELFDLNGRLVSAQAIAAQPGKAVQMNMPAFLTAGTYVLRARQHQQRWETRFVRLP